MIETTLELEVKEADLPKVELDLLPAGEINFIDTKNTTYMGGVGGSVYPVGGGDGG